jgi:hypothetical protein
LTDQRGHIDLFPQALSKAPVTKNAEATQEAAKKKQEYEDQYTMRFSNAAGFKQTLENPWYSQARNSTTASPPPTAATAEPRGKDVWGNSDTRRRERDATRTAAHDPLAAMRHGAARARQVERERKAWAEEKEREVRELKREEEERERKRRRRGGGRRRHEDGGDEDGLEGFSLDREVGDGDEMSRSRAQHGRDREERRKSRHKDSHSHHRRSHHGETTRHDRDRHRHRPHLH